MKILICGVHVDDEILGAGGLMSKVDPQNLFIVHCGLNTHQIHGDKFIMAEERLDEWGKVMKVLGMPIKNWKLLNHIPDPVNYMSMHDYIGPLEKIINEWKPEEIYLMNRSYNQDHAAVYDAAMVALRPHDKNHFVKKVFVCEQPQDFWGAKDIFEPNYFMPIDIDKKLHLYSLLKSQVREHRSMDHLRALAKIRGMQANCDYAEGFKILRAVC